MIQSSETTKLPWWWAPVTHTHLKWVQVWFGILVTVQKMLPVLVMQRRLEVDTVK